MLFNKINHKHSKTCCEEYNFTWRIKDFKEFKSSEDFLANQNMFFNMGSKINFPAKLQLYLQKSSCGVKTLIGLRLQECPQDASKVIVNLKVYGTDFFGDDWFWSTFTEDMFRNGEKSSRVLPHAIASIPNDCFCMRDDCVCYTPDLFLRGSITLFNWDRTERQNQPESYLVNWERNEHTQFSETIAKYLCKENTNTVLISKDDHEFPVMRDMICAQSPVIARMFQSGRIDKYGRLKISDVSGKALKVLLEYMHTGKLSESWTQPEITEEFVFATHKYQLKDLLEFEDNMLGFYCTKENVDALLDLAEVLDLKRAQKNLTEFKSKGESNTSAETVETALCRVEPEFSYSNNITELTVSIFRLYWAFWNALFQEFLIIPFKRFSFALGY